jgi:hypothetical protein
MPLFTQKSMSRIAALLASGLYQPAKREAETMNEILILGAGYTGMAAATGLVGRLKHRDDAHITIVNPQPRFTERLRLHQTASGRTDNPHRRSTAGTGVEFVQGWVTASTPTRRPSASTTHALRYDTLVYAGQRRRHRDGARVTNSPTPSTAHRTRRFSPITWSAFGRYRRRGRRWTHRRRVRRRDRQQHPNWMSCC